MKSTLPSQMDEGVGRGCNVTQEDPPSRQLGVFYLPRSTLLLAFKNVAYWRLINHIRGVDRGGAEVNYC